MSIPANLEQLDIKALHGVFVGLVQESRNCMPNARKDAAITDQADILNELPEDPEVMLIAIGKLSAKIDAAKRESHSLRGGGDFGATYECGSRKQRGQEAKSGRLEFRLS